MRVPTLPRAFPRRRSGPRPVRRRRFGFGLGPPSRPRLRAPAPRYAAAVGLVAAATALSVVFPDVLGRAAPFFAFYPAVVISGFIGGFGPGLLATTLSVFSAAYFNFEPAGTFVVEDFGGRIRVGLFFLLGSFLSWANQQLHDSARESEEAAAKYRSLFDSIDEGFCVIEVIFDQKERAVDYRFLEVNPVFARLTGFEDAVGKRIKELSPDHERSWLDASGRVALTGEPTRFEDHSALHDRWYDVYAWRHGEPEARQVAVLFSDITERRRRDEELERAVVERTRAIQEAADELESFSYTISHDLRAPLRAIQGYAASVLEREKDKLEPESVRRLSRVESSAARMDRLIRDVLIFGDIGRAKKAVAPVDLDSLVSHVAESYEPIRAASVKISGPLGRVLGQEALLTQAVANLLDNAVKFAKDGAPPDITVRSERPRPGIVRLVVEDHGVGIAPEDQGRLFAPFTRLASSKRGGGTGIGLAIVRKAIERLGGAVGVKSVPGDGSKFWFQLPEA